MSVNWLLPPQYTEAAREVLGEFIQHPDLNQPWAGKVFLAPPSGKIKNQSIQGLYANKLVDEYQAGQITEGIILVNFYFGYKWFAPLRGLPMSVLDHLIRYINPATGKPGSPAKQSKIFAYVGNDPVKFYKVFVRFGPCGQPSKD